MQLTVLGTGSATPTLMRNPTAHVLETGGEKYLIDCGEGTLRQMMLHKLRLSKLKYIFISHLHGDHYFGLMNILISLNYQDRTDDLWIFGPPGLSEIITLQFKYANTALRFQIYYNEVQSEKAYLLFENEHLTVETIPLVHRVHCSGYLFRTKNTESKSYAFCSDTIYNESIIPLVQGIDLLYHEATFGEPMKQWAKKTYHSTAHEAALIAQKAGVKRLMIGHYSARYHEVLPLLEEAQKVFENTVLAEEGMKYVI
jgi:ribonuclease Z